MRPTGTLRSWILTPWLDGKTRATGKVYGDLKGRFNDGSTITTSPIVMMDRDILVTERSIYKLGRCEP
jgi:hypothetical protein